MIVYSVDDSVFWGDMSMDKQATINQLITLKKDLETQRHEKDLLDRAISIRNSIQYTFRTRLDLFDETHKSAYISDMIGSEPIKPRGLIKLAVPVYLVKKSNYDKAIVEYLIKDYNKPMGVATFRTRDEMPEKFRKALPDIEELKKLL